MPAPEPLDLRLGLVFLGLSLVLLLGLAAGAAGVAVYLSWLAALAGLVIVLRASPRKTPAAVALGVLAGVILVVTLGSTLTVGNDERALARLGRDVLPEDMANLGIMAGPLSGAILLGMGGVPAAGALARNGTLLGLAGLIPLLLVEAYGEGWFSIAGIWIGGGVFLFPFIGGSILVGVAFLRAAWTAFRGRDAAPA